VAERFLTDFKRFFFYGLAAVLPTLLTLAIIVYVFTFLDKYMATYVNDGARWVLLKTVFRRAQAPAILADPQVWSKYFWWVGFLLSLVAIYIFGRFVASLLGRSVWRMVERAFFRTPVVKQIYPYVKQVTDFLFSNKQRMQFSRVVVVEYPRKGIWSLGLVTGAGMQSIGRTLGEEFLTVFIPSSPTPLTGYVITVRRDEVLDLPISIDDAIRFVISGGVIMPASQLPSDAETSTARQGRPLPLPR
jgi:uncharacterized membrane protein